MTTAAQPPVKRLRWHKRAGLCWHNEYGQPLYVGNLRWWKWPQRLIDWLPFVRSRT